MNLSNQKGAALVEMAIILPILLVLVFGILEYGRVMFMTNVLNNAAREGARRAAVTPTPINVDAYVTSCIPFDKTGIAIITSSTTSGSNTSVKVSITLPFQALTGLVPVPDTLSGEATMRYEL